MNTLKQQEEREYRVTNLTALFMIIFAIAMDVISVIPIVNIVLVPTGILILWIWFHFKGVHIGFKDPKQILRATSIGGTSLVEIIPALSTLPGWIAGTLAIIGFSRLEDVGVDVRSITDVPKVFKMLFTKFTGKKTEEGVESGGGSAPQQTSVQSVATNKT